MTGFLWTCFALFVALGLAQFTSIMDALRATSEESRGLLVFRVCYFLFLAWMANRAFFLAVPA